MSDLIPSTILHNVGDGAGLLNAAMEILARHHGLDGSGARIGVNEVAMEFADWKRAEELPADSPKAQALYDAALACACEWYGIADYFGFRRYLRRFSRNGKRP
jgi:hypothetical protein